MLKNDWDYFQPNKIIKWEQALENGEDIEEAVANASLPEKYQSL